MAGSVWPQCQLGHLAEAFERRLTGNIPALHPPLRDWLLEGPLSAEVPAYMARLHTTAMHLLQSGEPIEGIAIWLGHESPTTTHHYVEADLAMKEQALAKLQDPKTTAGRFRATDSLLKFLKTL